MADLRSVARNRDSFVKEQQKWRFHGNVMKNAPSFRLLIIEKTEEMVAVECDLSPLQATS